MSDVEECYSRYGHTWIKITHAADYKGKQCLSCPMCNQVIYWSDILSTWVNVTKKKYHRHALVNDLVATNPNDTTAAIESAQSTPTKNIQGGKSL